MAKCVFNNGRVIGDNERPYFIAEVNSSHNGSIVVAKEMIDKIKEIGADAVKFQSWSSGSLYSKDYYKENPISKRFFDKFSFDNSKFNEIIDYCKNKSISFASTPYSNEEVDFLVNVAKVPFIKIASMDINNYLYLEYIAKTGSAIVLSTGMSTYDEVDKAIDILKSSGCKNLCVLHCVSLYPVDYRDINLKNILYLKEKYKDIPIGFSDHSIGYEVPSAAIALGAVLIEKHFTLDKSKIGMDNQMATEPEEFKKMIDACLNVYESLGTKDRVVLDAEKEQLMKMRRSIVTKKKLSAGDIIKLEDIDFKRPADGISPDKYVDIIGKKLKIDKDEDSILSYNDLM